MTEIKYWWSEDKKWFCILLDDGISKATISLTPEEASLLSMNAVLDSGPAQVTDDTDHIDWDVLAEQRLGQRPIEHGRHIPQTSPAPGCDSGSHSKPQEAAVTSEIERLTAMADEQTTALDQIMTTAADNLGAPGSDLKMTLEFIHHVAEHTLALPSDQLLGEK